MRKSKYKTNCTPRNKHFCGIENYFASLAYIKNHYKYCNNISFDIIILQRTCLTVTNPLLQSALSSTAQKEKLYILNIDWNFIYLAFLYGLMFQNTLFS